MGLGGEGDVTKRLVPECSFLLSKLQFQCLKAKSIWTVDEKLSEHEKL